MYDAPFDAKPATMGSVAHRMHTDTLDTRFQRAQCLSLLEESHSQTTTGRNTVVTRTQSTMHRTVVCEGREEESRIRSAPPPPINNDADHDSTLE